MKEAVKRRRRSSIASASNAGLLSAGENDCKSLTPIIGGVTPTLDDPERVRVVVRVRPLNSDERGRGFLPCVKFPDAAGGIRTKLEVAVNRPGRNASKLFSVDHVIDPFCTQQTVFEASGIVRLLDYAIEGYSGTVFAYGQTGSGKTYTMSGDEDKISSGQLVVDAESAGLIPRAMVYLMRRIEQAPPGFTYKLTASFIEIYNETPRDLLNPESESLFVRWTAEDGFFVENQRVVNCHSADDLIAVFEAGICNRRVGCHKLNPDSSRSHSILTLTLESTHLDPVGNHMVHKSGKVSFVDLAGSERLRKTCSSGEKMLKEAGNINRSLFMLGKVISVLGAIHSGKKPMSTHVPYRDSMLTKLLMDSLGGNGRTLMISCCAPSSSHLEETLSTLNYATRARNIRNKPCVRMNLQTKKILTLSSRVGKLSDEVDRLRSLLQSAGMNPDSDSPASSTTSSTMTSPLTPSSVSSPAISSASSPPSRRFATRQKRRNTPRTLPPLSEDQSMQVDTASTRRGRAPIFNQISSNLHLLLEQKNSARENRHRPSAVRQYQQVIQENNRLVSKVENLERVFVERDDNAWETPDESLWRENVELKKTNQLLASQNAGMRQVLSHSAQRSEKRTVLSTSENKELLQLRRSNLKLLHDLESLQSHSPY